jgi:hypothetical protein
MQRPHAAGGIFLEHQEADFGFPRGNMPFHRSREAPAGGLPSASNGNVFPSIDSSD